MKYLYLHTWGTDAPARTSTPFQLAAAAALLGHEATIVFTTLGAQLMQKGAAENLVVAPGMPALRHFIDLARETDVKFLVCSASLDVTGLKVEDLIPEVDGFVGGVTVNEMAAEADVVMVF